MGPRARRPCRPGEEGVAARPLAGLAVNIFAKYCWALARAPWRRIGRLRRCRRDIVRAALAPLPIALPLPSSAVPAPFTGTPAPTGLPAPRRLPTGRTAIATLGPVGPEPLFTAPEQALPPAALPRPLRRNTARRILVTDHGRLHSPGIRARGGARTPLRDASWRVHADHGLLDKPTRSTTETHGRIRGESQTRKPTRVDRSRDESHSRKPTCVPIGSPGSQDWLSGK